MELKPISSQKVLDLYFLDNRCSLLEVAAFLDRIDRGGAPDLADPRLIAIKKALEVLNASSETPNRAERLLRLFS